MKKTLGLLCAVLLLVGLAPPSGFAQPRRPLVFGYVTWWMMDHWKAQPLAGVDRLMFIEFKVGPDGRVSDRHGWPERWGVLRAAVTERGIPLDIAFTLMEPALFNAVFASRLHTQRLMAEILAAARQPDVSGIHLDFEIYAAVRPDAVKSYRAFVVSLSQQLKQMAPQRLLSVFLTFDADKYLYDTATLAPVDHVVVQGYDAHWVDGPVAGPVAPLTGADVVTWEKMLLMTGRLGVPAEKTVMSFPLYGYEWSVKPCNARGNHVGKGETITFAPAPAATMPNVKSDVRSRVLKYGATHDPVTGSAYYLFQNEQGKCVVGWFEDWWTLSRKSDWVVAQNLAGIAFFPLGYDQSELVEFLVNRWRVLPAR